MTDDPVKLAREVLALSAKATEGPWKHYRDKLRPNFSTRINEVQCREVRTPVVRWSGFDESKRSEREHAANAAFIAHARTAAPALARAVLGMQPLLEALFEAGHGGHGHDDAGCAICAAIDALPPPPSAEMQWRPIAEAPRDHTSVIVCKRDVGGDITGEAYFYVNEDHRDGGEWYWANVSPGDYMAEPITPPPTAFIPLSALPPPPAPPKDD